MDNQQKQQLEEAKKEKLIRGAAFEGLIRGDGWKFIKGYIENKIKSFANEAIGTGFKDMEKYQYERGVVDGLRKLLGEIDSSIKLLEDERKKAKALTADKR